MLDKLKALFGGKSKTASDAPAADASADNMVDMAADTAHEAVDMAEDKAVEMGASEEMASQGGEMAHEAVDTVADAMDSNEAPQEGGEKFCEKCSMNVPADHSHEA